MNTKNHLSLKTRPFLLDKADALAPSNKQITQ